MNKLYLFSRVLLIGILLLLIGSGAHAQAPAWQTVVSSEQSGGNYAAAYASAADNKGNIIVAGKFAGTVSFSGTTLTSAGAHDVFVAKWSTVTAAFIWAQQFGGSKQDDASGLSVVGSSIYIVGAFSSPISAFGTLTLTNSNSTGSEGFLVKVTDAGTSANCVWAQRLSGSNNEEVTAVAANGGHIYVTGSFTSPTVTIGNLTLTNAGGFDLYVAKYDDLGADASLIWTQRAGGAQAERPTALAVNGTSIYVGGCFGGNASVFGNIVLASAGYSDAFVAKITDMGNSAAFVWALQSGGRPGASVGIDALDATASGVYAAGAFVTSPIHGVTLGSNTLYGDSQSKAFVTKISDAGTGAQFSWSWQTLGAGTSVISGLKVKGTNLYVAGKFAESVNFGTTNYASLGGLDDAFVACLFDAGTNSGFAWAQRAGGFGYDAATALTLYGSRVYVVGYANPSAFFGSLTVNVPGAGNDELAFLAGLADATVLGTARDIPLAGYIIFPNPAHNRATIQLPAIPGTTTATLTVLDALGRTLRTQPAALNAKAELDLAGLPAGLYAVRVQAGGSTTTRRLVVE